MSRTPKGGASGAIVAEQPRSALVEAGQALLLAQQDKAELERHEKVLREYIVQGMKKNRLKSLKMEDGTVFTMKEGNRKVVIKNQEKAEKYLEEMDCWKPDTAKLLKIFGRMLKVPPFFKIERGEQTLAIISPKAHGARFTR